MAVHGKATTILFNAYDVSGYLNATDFSTDVDTSDITVYQQGWKTFLAGLADATVGFGGFYDPTNAATLDAAIAVDSGVLTYCPGGGAAVGDLARLLSVTETNVTRSSPVGDVVALGWDVHSQASVGFGQVLHPLGDTVGMPVNGAFESDVTGWVGAASGSVARSTAEMNSGAACMRITASTSANSGATYAITGTFTSGRTYRLSAYIKKISGTDDSWAFEISDGADANFVSQSATGTFTIVTVDWTPSGTRTSVSLKFLHSDASAAVLAVDDVSVQLLDAAKDDGAATSTGWTAHLHVTAAGGSIGDFRLEDSANGTTWAAVSGGSFSSTGGAATSQRLTSSSATSTLRRYVRVAPYAQTWLNATAYGPVTYHVSYSRSY